MQVPSRTLIVLHSLPNPPRASNPIVGSFVCFIGTDGLSIRGLGPQVPQRMPIVLCGTKSDLERSVRTDDAVQLATDTHALHIDCSAKTGANVEFVFDEIARMVAASGVGGGGGTSSAAAGGAGASSALALSLAPQTGSGSGDSVGVAPLRGGRIHPPCCA